MARTRHGAGPERDRDPGGEPGGPDTDLIPAPAPLSDDDLPAVVSGPTVAVLDDEHAIVRGLWRGVDVFRWLALVYAAWSVWERHEQIAHLVGAVAILGVLAGWTLAVTLRPMRTVRAYTVEPGHRLLRDPRDPARRRPRRHHRRRQDHPLDLADRGRRRVRRAARVARRARRRLARRGVLLRRGGPADPQHHHQLDLRAPARWLHRLLRRPRPLEPRGPRRGHAARRGPCRARPARPDRARRGAPDAGLHQPPRERHRWRDGAARCDGR